MASKGRDAKPGEQLIDISIPFAPHVPVWPGDTPFECGWKWRRENGSSVNLAAITTSAHAGTHADAPLHVESHWEGSESLPVAPFVGRARVLSLAAGRDIGEDITVDELKALGLVDDCHRLLLRTSCSVDGGVFPEEWPALHPDTAVWLAARGMRLIGVDAPSVDRRTSSTLPVHHALFERGVYVVENLRLGDVADGEYELLAQPLALHGADAAPLRALLRAI